MTVLFNGHVYVFEFKVVELVRTGKVVMARGDEET